MVRKPISGDSEQRERAAERARRHSQISAAEPGGRQPQPKSGSKSTTRRPLHGGAEGESAHGALPRRGIEYEQGDD